MTHLSCEVPITSTISSEPSGPSSVSTRCSATFLCTRKAGYLHTASESTVYALHKTIRKLGILSGRRQQVSVGNAFLVIARQYHKTDTLSVTNPPRKSYIVYHKHSTEMVYARSALKHAWEVKRSSDRTEFPLLDRGWIYEERSSVRRMVHYTNRGVTCECNGGRSCQCVAPSDQVDLT